MNNLQIELHDAKQATDFAQGVAKVFDEKSYFNQGFIIYLMGDLGAGKSHFSRGFIQTFLPNQKVKSPTYTIVESYNFSTNSIYHLDLYRLCDPEELEYLAIRDLFVDSFVALIEWPMKGVPILPAADAVFEFSYQDFSGKEGRKVQITPQTEKGQKLINAIRAVSNNDVV